MQRASVRRRTLPLLGFALIASLLSDRVSTTTSFRLVQPTWIVEFIPSLCTDPCLASFLFHFCGTMLTISLYRCIVSCTAFKSGCAASGIELEDVPVTATPTGTASTGDPLSMFEAPTPTSGATAAVTYALPPLIPTQAEINTKIGSAIGLNAFRALGTSVVVATAATIVMLGVSSL